MKRPHPRAFTLLEIMLAVTILSLVMTAVFAIWSTALTAWKRGLALTENFQRGRVVLEALEELAGSVVFSPSDLTVYELMGDHDPSIGSVVSFVTASDYLLLPSESAVAGLRRVTIEMDRDADGRPYLALISMPALAEESAGTEALRRVLSADVIYFRVRYRDPRDSSWTDFWRQPDVLPSALEFTVAFGPGDRGVAPVLVTRAVELPTAKYALALMGKTISDANTTNEVVLPDINLSELTEPADTGGE